MSSPIIYYQNAQLFIQSLLWPKRYRKTISLNGSDSSRYTTVHFYSYYTTVCVHEEAYT